MPQFLSPVCNDQTFDANGDPLTAGQIETYLAGSSTPAATYTDDTGVTPQSNPIILNSLGYPTLGAIWLTGGISYKFIIKDALGATLRTIDDISGINDTTSSQSEWVESGLVPTYIGATSFSVPGDQTGILQINRRLRTQNTSGFIYSTISGSVFAAGITTVTLVNDSGTLDAGLSSVAYGLLAATPSSIPAIQTAGIADKAVTLAKIQDIATARILGRDTVGSGSVEELTGAEVVALLPITDKIQPITATVNSVGGAPANGMRITLNPTTLDFRDPSLASGAVTTVNLAAAVTADISSGSTLGFNSGVLGQVNVYAMNNGGTIELAYVNALSGLVLNESGLMSTTAEGGAGGADSATTIYSTTARSNLPYRFVGYWQATEATAGTWVTAPSLIQGAGGLATTAMQTSTLMTPVTLSGISSAEFLNIPSWAKKVTVIFYGASLSDANNFRVQLGTASSWETTGYAGSTVAAITAAVSSGVADTGGIPVFNNGAANVTSGAMELYHLGANLWSAKGVFNIEGGGISVQSAGRKGMPGVATRVRVVPVGGAATLDGGGTINAIYE